MTSSLLDVQGLTVTYPARGHRGSGTRALKDVSLQVPAGSTVALVGESGSGKSTLGNTVLGLVRPTSGRILFDGRDITRAGGAERRALSQEIQAVFQDPYSSFNPNRTVGQTVGETLLAAKCHGKTEIARRVRVMLERVGLDGGAASRYPAQFSGGQRQRIAIARALLPRPRLVVCDESVSALDLSVQAQILNLLADLQRDFAIAYLFITHDMSVVRHISKRVVVLRRGEMVEEGLTPEVMATPTADYTRNLVASAPVPDPKLQELRREARRAAKALQELEESPSGESSVDLGWLVGSLERKCAYDVAASPDRTLARHLGTVVTALDSSPDVKGVIRFRMALLEGAGAVHSDFAKSVLERSVDAQERGVENASSRDYADRITLIRALYQRIVAEDASGAATAVTEYSATPEPIGSGANHTKGDSRGAEQGDAGGTGDRMRTKVSTP